MCSFRRLTILALIGAFLALPRTLQAQGYSGPPVFQPPATGLTLPYTGGTVTVGGVTQVIQAGSVLLADNQNSCVTPKFAACNIVYWGGSGPNLTNTTSLAAFTAGTAVVAYVLTSGGSITAVVQAAATYPLPPGVLAPAPVSTVATPALRLPLCNVLLQQGCQAATTSLSGYPF